MLSALRQNEPSLHTNSRGRSDAGAYVRGVAPHTASRPQEEACGDSGVQYLSQKENSMRRPATDLLQLHKPIDSVHLQRRWRPIEETKKMVVGMIQTLNSIAPPDAMRAITALAVEKDAHVILSVLKGESFSSTTTTTEGRAPSLELALQNPIAYPALRSSSLLGFGTSYTKLDYNSGYDSGDPIPATDISRKSSRNSRSKESSRRPSDSNTAVHELCDSRLRELDIRKWTAVDIDNDVATRCISLYLETDHPLLGHFDPNLFVSDLVFNGDKYCSPLLVNALLYWACQMYSYIDPKTEQHAMPFRTEAERLWATEREAGHDTVANMAAAELLCLGYLGQGKDHAILDYVSEASEMGIRMGLFGVKAPDGAEVQPHMVDIVDDDKRWQAHAAWGVFNWITLMSLFYRQPGLFCPKHPPRMPIPECRPQQEHATKRSRPSSSHYMGSTFPYICHFWHIVHEVSVIYYGDGQSPWGSGGSLAFAEFKFRELLAWSNRLPKKLAQGRDHPHHVQILHLWFHAAILDVFRPCMQQEWQRVRPLRTFVDRTVTPRAVCDASTAQLKHLIADYRREHSSSRYTILWHTALIYVANAILNDQRDSNWYADLLVCLYGYEKLGRSWRVALGVAKSLLSLAMRKGIFSSRTARLILHDLQNKDLGRIPEEFHATFMADLNLAMSDPASATVEQLADQFDTYAFMKEYTTVLDENR